MCAYKNEIFIDYQIQLSNTNQNMALCLFTSALLFIFLIYIIHNSDKIEHLHDQQEN